MINYVGNIDYYREKLKLTKTKMCEIAGISLSSYNDMYKRNHFYTETLEKLAFALKVKVSNLVREDSSDDQKEKLKDFDDIIDKMKDFKDKHL